MRNLNNFEIDSVSGGGLFGRLFAGVDGALLGAANGAWSGARIGGQQTALPSANNTDLLGLNGALGNLWAGLGSLIGTPVGAIAGAVGGFAAGISGGSDQVAIMLKQFNTNASN